VALGLHSPLHDVGATVGVPEGDADGLALGAVVGTRDGDKDGLPEGAVLGDSVVGAAEGASVGGAVDVVLQMSLAFVQLH
jgi:hypothetical protein